MHKIFMKKVKISSKLLKHSVYYGIKLYIKFTLITYIICRRGEG